MQNFTSKIDIRALVSRLFVNFMKWYWKFREFRKDWQGCLICIKKLHLHSVCKGLAYNLTSYWGSIRIHDSREIYRLCYGRWHTSLRWWLTSKGLYALFPGCRFCRACCNRYYFGSISIPTTYYFATSTFGKGSTKKKINSKMILWSKTLLRATHVVQTINKDVHLKKTILYCSFICWYGAPERFGSVVTCVW